MSKTQKPADYDIQSRDNYYWEQIEKLIKKRNFTLNELFEHFPAYVGFVI